MSKSKITALAFCIALWVTVFVFIESVLGGILGFSAWTEFWPALMSSSLIGLLGKDKAAEKKFYLTAATGILAALLFVELEHLLVPVIGADMGVLSAMCIAVFVVIFLQFMAPSIAGPVSFVYFNAATVLTNDILPRTVVRLAVMVIGTFVFLKVEHFIVGMMTGAHKKHAAEKTE